MKNPTILVTGANGESLPPPYGGIIKRCLLHAKEWKDRGSRVFVHIHHKHDRENDLGAGATYFYDFQSRPNVWSKGKFIFKWFFKNPSLFIHLFTLDLKTNPDAGRVSLYYAARGVRLEEQVKEVKPDIIVSETGAPQSLGALEIAKRNHIPFVLENFAEIQFKAGPDGKNIAEEAAPMWRPLMNESDLVVSASEHCSRGPKSYMKDLTKLKIVYSGINFEIFNRQAMKPRPELRAQFELPQDRFLIMAVGALRMRKGHDQLFEALLRMPPEELVRMTVVLCGMGNIPELQERAKEIGFPEDRLRIFQGLPEEKLAELYASMDAFCFPSITPRECMGMAMKEAMSAGLPVAAYASGGISEAIEEGVNGFLAPTGDRDALAAAVSKLLHMSAEERTQMGQRNIEKSKRLFDIKDTADQLYRELVRLTDRAA